MQTLIVEEQATELAHIEARIERTMRHAWYETAMEYERIKKENLYGQHGWTTWAEYCQERWNRTYQAIDLQIQRANELLEISKIFEIPDDKLPASVSHVSALAKLETPELRAEVWQRILAQQNHRGITAKMVQAEVEKKLAELDRSWCTLDEWHDLTEAQRFRLWEYHDPKTAFNRTNENIEWAAWSWNPVTGCKHGCAYCYARDIANRFYPQGFVPSLHPGRLSAPWQTKQIAPRWKDDQGHKSVFVCSMADLFGEWVPEAWIDAVIDEVDNSPQWTYIFLTKNPERLVHFHWPENAVVGATVDTQERVQAAEQAFSQIDAPVKFLSCEPLRGQVILSRPDLFDWVIIGGQSKSSQASAKQPRWEWVESLHWQAHRAGCKVYWKTNLTVRPRQYPSW